ncbi:MAG TPA: COX15/CtaA family protein [Frankiaceae bacterium]
MVAVPALPASRQLRVGQHLLVRLSALTLFLLGAIVVTGAAVRLTGSGLGCPTWPECTDTSLVNTRAYGIHGFIEFGNRLITTAVFLAIAATTLVAAWTARRTGNRQAVWLCGGLVLGYVGQAVLGGITVLFDLAPLFVAAHFLLSMVLIVNAAALLTSVERTTAPAAAATGTTPRAWRLLILALALTSALVLVAGTMVTGAGPHSGGSLHTPRLPFSARSAAQLHADLAFLLCGLTIAAAATSRLVRVTRTTRRRVDTVVGLVIAQIVLGLVQYALAVPPVLVLAHVALATALFTVAVRLTQGAAEQPAPAVDPTAEQVLVSR